MYWHLPLGIVKEGIFVCFVKNGCPITEFAGIESPISVHAECLTSTILNCSNAIEKT